MGLEAKRRILPHLPRNFPGKTLQDLDTTECSFVALWPICLWARVDSKQCFLWGSCWPSYHPLVHSPQPPRPVWWETNRRSEQPPLYTPPGAPSQHDPIKHHQGEDGKSLSPSRTPLKISSNSAEACTVSPWRITPARLRFV